MKYADSASNKFQQYSSPSWRNAYANTPPDKFVDYQDPTYIGFYVRFYGTGPDGLGERPAGPENVVGLDEWPGGLFLHEDHPNSAVRYLKNIGEYTRAQMLREFIYGIKQVSEEMPWYFTKVTGLEDIWKINPADSFRGKEKKVTFDTLESIDLKITYLLDLYRKVVFDSVYMRYMLPENLRYFNMDIVVTEIRNFHRPAAVLPYTNDSALTQDVSNFENPIKPGPLGNINIPGLTEQGIQSAISAVVPNSTWASGLSKAVISTMNRDSSEFSNYPVLMSDFNDLATFLVFSFGHCEFDAFSEAPSYFGSLGKVPNTVATNKMTINTNVIREFNTYGLLGSIVQDTLGSTDRIQDAADSLFWKKVGNNLAAAKVPDSELAYLNGIKMEFFNTTKRFADERSLREENARLGGLLGNLLNNAVQIGSSALNNAIQGAVARAVLGNALQNTFGSTISDDIAKQIILTAPEIVPALLTNVVLEANGASTTNTASQAAVPLESPEIAEPGVLSVFLTGPSTANTTLSTVFLEGPVIGNATLIEVALEAPTVNASVDPMVILSAPPANAGLSGSAIVNLDAPTIQTNDVVTVTLESPSSSESDPGSDPGSVKLEGATSNESALGEVVFEALTLPGISVGSVEFASTPTDSMIGGAVELIAAESNTDVTRSVELEQPTVQTSSSSDKVSLESPQIESSVVKKVELTGTIDSETNPGITKFEEATVNGIGKTEVEFVSAETSKQKPGAVQLDAPSPIDTNVSFVALEAPNTTQSELGKEDLISPTITNAALGEVSFEETDSSEAALSNVNLTGANISKVDLDAVTFDGAETSARVLTNVDFNENDNESTIVAKVNLESPSPQKTELDKVKFDEVTGGSGGIKTGAVPLDAPPMNLTALGNSMDGIDTQQDKK